MSANDTLIVFTALNGEFPSSNYAFLDIRNNHSVLSFDASTDYTAYFGSVLPNTYKSNGIKVIISWMAATATSGSCRWEAAFERHDEASTDLDSNSFASTNSTGDTAPGTSGQIRYSTILFTNTEIDGLLKGESFRLLIRRDADGTTGTDNMAGNAQLLRVELRESF